MGSVGRPSARSAVDLLDPVFEDRIVRFDGDREAGVGLGVFVAAIDLGFAGQASTSLINEFHITLSGVSNTRPQPSANKVSPQNAISSSANQ